MIRHILRRISCRLIILISINTEDREIPGMAGPYPIICISAKLAYRRGRSKYQTNIIIILIHRQIKLITTIKRSYLSTQQRIIRHSFLSKQCGNRIHNQRTVIFLCSDWNSLQHTLRHILCAYQKTDK